ncbi:MAG: CbtB domain-containing protein [Pseudooceanicola sp.]
MNTTATASASVSSATGLGAILAAAVIGLGLIVFAGHLQASTLHDAAHDVRHATGFPCH